MLTSDIDVRGADAAINDLRTGRMVVVVDDANPCSPGNLVSAATYASSDVVAFMIRHTGGILHVAMPERELDRLHLSPGASDRRGPARVQCTMSADARSCAGSGMSAADRAHTISVLADPVTRPPDLLRPGHVFLLPAVDGGVLQREGATEAAVDLVRLAGLRPAAVVGEVISRDGTVAHGESLRRFAASHGLSVVSLSSLVAHRYRHERTVEILAETRLPTEYGEFRAMGFRSAVDGRDHIALVSGCVDVATSEPPLARVQSECLIGNTFQSSQCECGSSLRWALRTVAAEGRGAIVYLRGGSDCGAGLRGAHLGIGSQILHSLGLSRVRLLTPDSREAEAFRDFGIDASAVPGGHA